MFDTNSESSKSSSSSSTLPHKTPKKIKRIDGLHTLSSNKKKISLRNVNKINRFIKIDVHFEHGWIKMDSFSKFAINIFQYILYDRNTIPMPFPYFAKLRDFLFEQSHQFPKKKILLETFSKLELIFKFIHDMFSDANIPINSLALCLGDSMRFASEIFILDFENLNLSPDSYQSGQFLTLRYLIDSFYKRLLNEIPEEMPEGKPDKVRRNHKNIIFAVRTSSQLANELVNFSKIYSENNQSILEASKLHLNITNHAYRLGSTMSKTTQFRFNHQIAKNENFDIFLDENVEEVIEEKIEMIDEENESDALSEDSPKHVATKTTNNVKQSIESEDIGNDNQNLIWLQISSPIQCVTKV